MIFIG
jgi:hypothetical protein